MNKDLEIVKMIKAVLKVWFQTYPLQVTGIKMRIGHLKQPLSSVGPHLDKVEYDSLRNNHFLSGPT